MSFKINEFTSRLNATGISKQDRFEVRITPPNSGGPSILSKLISGLSSLGGTVGDLAGIVGGIGSVDTFHLAMRADAAELPGRTVQTLDNRYYGPIQKTGYNSNYIDTTISFICSEDHREKLFFEKWQDLIVGDHREGKNELKMSQYNSGYYDDYVSTVEIAQFNENNDETYTIKLIEAYPILVNPLSLSWNTDEIHRLQVAFAYRYFEDKSNKLSKTAATIFNGINALTGNEGSNIAGINTSQVRRGLRFLDKIL
jgi:hypothetical protein